jgi:phenylacetate-coenzyme A ligase PaaK-like adenylate-forming protein
MAMQYWNPYLETLSGETLLEIELSNFRKLLQYAREHSPLYRQRYKDIIPEDIKTKEDLRRLPLLDKEDLRAAQEGKEPSLYGEVMGVPHPLDGGLSGDG